MDGLLFHCEEVERCPLGSASRGLEGPHCFTKLGAKGYNSGPREVLPQMDED
jgi:hypothetical protein